MTDLLRKRWARLYLQYNEMKSCDVVSQAKSSD